MKKEKKSLVRFIFMMFFFVFFTFHQMNVHAQINQPFLSLGNRIEEVKTTIENPLNTQRLSYEEIYGKAQIIPMNTPVLPLSLRNNDYEFQVNLIGATVDLTDQTQGYLLGDPVKVEVIYSRGATDNISAQIPKTALGTSSGLGLVGDNEITLTLDNNRHIYEFTLTNQTPNKYHTIPILFSHSLNNVTPYSEQINTGPFYLRNGSIQVSLEEGLDSSLLANTEVTLTDANDNPVECPAVIENDGLVFNEVPSGEYKVKVEGDEFRIEDTIITLNYANPTASVTINESLKPDIEVELTEFKPGSVVHDRETVTMTYTLMPKPFNATNDKLNKVTEALFVVDVSREMTDERKGQVVATIQQMLEKASPSLNIGVMGYDSEIIYSTNNAQIPFYQVSDDTEKGNFITDLESIVSHVSQEGRDLSAALEKADNVMTSLATSNSKAIILISQDQVEFDSNILSTLHVNDYQFITLSLSDTSVTNQTALKDVHAQLASSETYFEILTEDTLSYAINQVNQMLSSVITVNPTLTFDLGTNFESVEGLTPIQDTSYELKAPEIVYELDATTNEYKASEVTVSFKIKVVNASPNDSITFVDSTPPVNYLSYEQIDGMSVMKSIDVPTFTVEKTQVVIEHGLYGGISDNQINILSDQDEENPNGGIKTFVEGSTVNFASTFEYQPYYTGFSLILNPKLTVSPENIKVYQVTEDTDNISLNLVETVDVYIASFPSETKIILNLYNKVTAGDKILVLYSARVPKGNNIEYKNQMIVDKTTKEISIKGIDAAIDSNDSSKSNLPFLF